MANSVRLPGPGEGDRRTYDPFESPVLVGSPVLRHVDEAATALAEEVYHHGRDASREWRDRGIRLLGTAVSTARHGFLPLDDETTGQLLFALTDVGVRDAACELTSDGPGDPVESMLVDLVVRAPSWLAAPPATVLGFVRWRRRDFAGAVRSAQLALNHDPNEGMAALVLQAAFGGLDPACWEAREAGEPRREPAEHVRTRRRRPGRRTPQA